LPDCSSVFERLGLVSPETGPSTAAARNEQEQRLHELLNQLKPADRQILQMIEFEGRAYAELAELLNIDNGAARVRHTRALRRLKDLWKKTFPEGLAP
jgi:RNA polymerase sigma-70 factor (ECF subfamily)